ncbi:PH domain-containing protein [Nocardiopsis potens]|uniref:PH domain-containing protein n=1 Tax=Nocardiopsis potens TaxID=1246458 RepID=UPI0003472DA7
MEYAASDAEHRAAEPGADGGAPPEGRADTDGAAAPEQQSEETGRSGEGPSGPEPFAQAGPEPGTVEAAFAPPDGGSWVRVSPALDRYLRLTGIAAAVVVGAPLSALCWLWLGPVWALAAAVLALASVPAAWFTAGRVRRSWGYAEGRTDLCLTYGLAVRQLVVVPYGRMQVVDVTANLLEQALGIATVRVRTAATTADTRIPGLDLDTAVGLRDRLAARSETFSTGL